MKHKTQIEKSILMVPLFIAFIWMGFLVINMDSASTNMQLSPTRMDALINALFIFILVYAAILAFLFIRMHNTHHSHLEKKVKKHKKK